MPSQTVTTYNYYIYSLFPVYVDRKHVLCMFSASQNMEFFLCYKRSGVWGPLATFVANKHQHSHQCLYEIPIFDYAHRVVLRLASDRSLPNSLSYALSPRGCSINVHNSLRHTVLASGLRRRSTCEFLVRRTARAVMLTAGWKQQYQLGQQHAWVSGVARSYPR